MWNAALCSRGGADVLVPGLDALDEHRDGRLGDLLAHRDPRWTATGVVNRPSAMLSNPMTATSSGTRRPALASARRAPMARLSLSAKTASNSTPDASSSRVASTPFCGSHGATARSSRGSCGRPADGERLPVAPHAQVRRAQLPGAPVGVGAEDGDAAPAEAEQVLDGRACALDVVHRDVVARARRRCARRAGRAGRSTSSSRPRSSVPRCSGLKSRPSVCRRPFAQHGGLVLTVRAGLADDHAQAAPLRGRDHRVRELGEVRLAQLRARPGR